MSADVFLKEEDWRAFKNYGAPVRAADSSGFKQGNPKTPDTVCWFCGLRGTDPNPLEAAHRIPTRAVLDLALDLDVLNDPSNFVWAHRRICNDAVELKPRQIMWRLMSFGIRELPPFLPRKTLDQWTEESSGVFVAPLAGEKKIEEKRLASPAGFPTVPPTVEVRREEFKPPAGAPTPPPPSAVQANAPEKPGHFPTVPSPSEIRGQKKPKNSSNVEVRSK